MGLSALNKFNTGQIRQGGRVQRSSPFLRVLVNELAKSVVDGVREIPVRGVRKTFLIGTIGLFGTVGGFVGASGKLVRCCKKDFGDFGDGWMFDGSVEAGVDAAAGSIFLDTTGTKLSKKHTGGSHEGKRTIHDRGTGRFVKQTVVSKSGPNIVFGLGALPKCGAICPVQKSLLRNDMRGRKKSLYPGGRLVRAITGRWHCVGAEKMLICLE